MAVSAVCGLRWIEGQFLLAAQATGQVQIKWTERKNESMKKKNILCEKLFANSLSEQFHFSSKGRQLLEENALGVLMPVELSSPVCCGIIRNHSVAVESGS